MIPGKMYNPATSNNRIAEEKVNGEREIGERERETLYEHSYME